MNDKADFTQGSILKKLVLFMLPVLGALILQAAYGAVDLLVVGRFWLDFRTFCGFYGKSGFKSGYICGDSVCNGYYGFDCTVSG